MPWVSNSDVVATRRTWICSWVNWPTTPSPQAITSRPILLGKWVGALESSAAYIYYIIIIIKERGVVRVECWCSYTQKHDFNTLRQTRIQPSVCLINTLCTVCCLSPIINLSADEVYWNYMEKFWAFLSFFLTWLVLVMLVKEFIWGAFKNIRIFWKKRQSISVVRFHKWKIKMGFFFSFLATTHGQH